MSSAPPASPPPPAPHPSSPHWFDRFDDGWARVERTVVWVCLAVMVSVVFLDVVHRVATREGGLIVSSVGRVLAGGAATAVIWLVRLVFGAVLIYLVLRQRGCPKSGKTVAQAVLASLCVWAGLTAIVFLLPNGVVWAQTLALVLMLWVACIGASLAARENRHLAIDLTGRIWSTAAARWARAAGAFVTSAFCFLLVVLSIKSIRSHYGDWASTDGEAGLFHALAFPKWLAYSPLPVGFFGLTVRFFAQAIRFSRGTERELSDEEETLRQLGIEKQIAQADQPATTDARR
jgi:TRAP-type C4-dicarboxylate transport system permease small subunit